jgi:hypothetical protein
MRRSNRMEFDARLVRGEAAGTGAVILFDRAERPLPTLTERRTRFLRRTVERVFGDRPVVAPPRAAPQGDEAPTAAPTAAAETETEAGTTATANGGEATTERPTGQAE